MTARRIDVHFHVIPAFYKDAVYAAGRGPAIGRYPDWTPELALELMDGHEIAVALTSVAQPGVQFAAPAAAATLARRCNDYAAELMARWPQRFGAFGLVPMHDTGAAIEEIDYCLDKLRFDGVCLFASYAGRFLGDAVFDPVLEALDARAAVVFVHPTLHPSSRDLGLPWPGFIMEYLFDTTRAAVNLLFSGRLERYRRLRFILAHAGGTLPYFAWRLSVSPMIDTRLPRWSRAEILAGLRRFFFDTALSSGAGTMMALREVAAPERILFGSDWPFATTAVVAEELEAHQAPGLHSAAARAAIDRENAAVLFPRFAS